MLATVPQMRQREGDFSSTLNAAGQLVRVYDPATVRSSPGVGSGYVRDPFPGNQIPRSRFDAVAPNAVKIWAAPNLPGDGPAQINNFLGSPSVPSTQDQFTLKIDQVFGTKHRTFGRYTYSRLIPGERDLFNTVRGARTVSPFEMNTSLKVWAKGFALDHTWIISPALLANFRYGFTRQRQFRDPASLGFDLTSIGFAKRFNDEVQTRMLPSFAPQGFQTVGEGGDNVLFRRGDNVHSAQASFTRTLTRQNLKFGFEFRSFLFNDTRSPRGGGDFAFNSAFTQADPLRANATAGHSIASLLLGLPSGGSAQYFPAVSLNQVYYALYVQDDFRMTSRLTLNFGLRWDLETPRTERYNRLSSLDLQVQSPLAAQTGLDLRGGLRFLGVDGVSRAQWEKDWNNFAPRFGFAYQIHPRFVARGGYGIFFQQTVGHGGLIGNGDDGFGTTNSMVTSNDGGITPADRLNNPFPSGMSLPSGSSLGLMTLVGQSLRQWSREFPMPYSQQYNFGLQYEFPRLFLADISYVGRHAVGIPVSRPLNQMAPEHLQLENKLLEKVTNPFYGIIKTGALAAAGVTRNRLLRPYPHFDAISLIAPYAHESYNSMQLRLERRLSRGFGVLLGYTIAKSLTNAGGGAAFSGFNSPAYQNVYDPRDNRSLSPNDISQRLVLSYQWQLPFGKGMWLFDGAKGVVDKLVSGWQLSGITTLQAGSPLAIGVQANQVQAFSGARPNIRPGASAKLPSDQRSIQRWSDTSVFSQPAPFRFGNAPRTLSDARGPGLQNFDLSLVKKTGITERVNLQLRFEFFNAFNRANFGTPGTTLGTAQFGVISSTGPARMVQVAAKLVF